MALTYSIFRVLGVGAALMMTAPAHGQDYTHGNFRVRVQMDAASGEDQSVAMLFVRSPADDAGMISWMCTQGGVQPGVRLGGTATDGTQRVVWRFDSDRPDTVALEALTGASTWFVPRDRVVPFTTRARSASRLAIRVLGGPRAADYTYDLTGSTAALNRLACARAPRPPQGPPGARASSSTTKERPREDAEDTYQLSAVEERPSPINTRDLLRALERNYPPLLRDARVTGTVHARFRVMADGSVDTASIRIVSSTHEEFNQATINAVGVLRFRPAKVGGRPVRVWVELPITWMVEGPPADSASAQPNGPSSFSGRGAGDEGTYEVSAVEELPRPLNTRDLSRALESNYPPLLRDARVSGTVEVRFRVTADGRVDPESISIVSSTLEQFEEPTRTAVRVLRFSPAQVNGRAVATWITLPIRWTPPS